MKNIELIIIVAIVGILTLIAITPKESQKFSFLKLRKIYEKGISDLEIDDQPEWQNYPRQRRVIDRSLGNVLADLESHYHANHRYKDNNKVTWAHELTHGINADIRNKYRQPGFYCLNDKICLIEQPRIKLEDIARNVPHSLRGRNYNIYLKSKAWSNQPLYVLDELVSYRNGAKCRQDLKIKERYDTIETMTEICIYAIVLIKTTNQLDKNYNCSQLESFVGFLLDEAIELSERENKQVVNLINHSDAATIKKFMEIHFPSQMEKILSKSY